MDIYRVKWELVGSVEIAARGPEHAYRQVADMDVGNLIKLSRIENAEIEEPEEVDNVDRESRMNFELNTMTDRAWSNFLDVLTGRK